MSIPYDPHNHRFSLKVSQLARETIYNDYFGRATYVDPSDLGEDARFMLDGQQGVDLIVQAPDKVVLVQERFRRAYAAKYREVTVTGANVGSNTTADFFKLAADVYAYGYVNDDISWIEAVLVDVPRMKELYRDGTIDPNVAYYKRKNQIIWGFPFDELEEHGAILYSFRQS